MDTDKHGFGPYLCLFVSIRGWKSRSRWGVTRNPATGEQIKIAAASVVKLAHCNLKKRKRRLTRLRLVGQAPVVRSAETLKSVTSKPGNQLCQTKWIAESS
jgi:hypothetical protein